MDLKFPHHENEIAQSEAHSNGNFANVWMHCGLLNIEGQKMSKSLNNFVRLSEGVERYGVAPLRFAVARHHYRSSLDLSHQLIRENLNSLLDFHRLFNRVPTEGYELQAADREDLFIVKLVEDFEAAMDNDFNTPEAMVVLEQSRNAIVRELDTQPSETVPEVLKARVAVVRQLGFILGVFFDSLERVQEEGLIVVGNALGIAPLSPGEIAGALKERLEARAAKNFARSDEMRAYLSARGVEVLDSKAGTTWRFA